jgi:hypothetical protein
MRHFRVLFALFREILVIAAVKYGLPRILTGEEINHAREWSR